MQDYTIGIQHSWKGTIFEARYVGNHGVDEFRAFDYNQVIISQNGFLPQFNLARQNGFLSLAAGVFNPSYNPSIKGSQPLPLIQATLRIGLTKGGLGNSRLRSDSDRRAVNFINIGKRVHRPRSIFP